MSELSIYLVLSIREYILWVVDERVKEAVY